ncbi:MAG TPA: SRPBCC domain-containing protein [Candidatus Binatus sp.]|nr:SRPBCC domain-containing protein [Candidatus Binatus sp.]
MAEKPANADTTLRVSRIFAAPRQKIFEAWTAPEKLSQWMCRVTARHSTKLIAMDLRVGGRYRLEVTNPDGSRILLSGIYREIKPSERLVFTWQWEGDPDSGETLVTVDLHARGNSTELVLTHERFLNSERRDRHAAGWSACFNTLKESLSV